MTRALVIEDNDNNMELVTFLLEHHGFATIQARTGTAGVELALAEQPDFIILDIQLPDISGEVVLQRIRSRQRHHVPIIAMTSYAMAGDAERLLAAGCDGYIEKPIDPMTVIAQIRKVLAEQ